MNTKVYLLSHAYEYGEQNEHEEIKILGIYSSKENALNALKNYKTLAGFNNYSEECFFVDEYPIDKDIGWIDGFISCD